MVAQCGTGEQVPASARKGHIGLYDRDLKKKVEDAATRWCAVGLARAPGEGGITDATRHLVRLGLAVVKASGGPEAGMPMAAAIENLLREALGRAPDPHAPPFPTIRPPKKAGS